MNYGWRLRTPLLLALIATTAGAQVLPLRATPAEPTASASQSTRSLLFDLKAAEDLQLRQQPIYVESVTVFGHRSEPAKIPLEQRFANALNAPAPAGTMEIRAMDTTPCLSMASTWNNIGSSFAPPTGCPR
jgi:hypothetical protein